MWRDGFDWSAEEAGAHGVSVGGIGRVKLVRI